MANEISPTQPPTEKVQRVYHFTRQHGIGALVGGLIMALQPTLAHFQTKDVAEADMKAIQLQLNAQSLQMNDFKVAIKDVATAVKDAQGDLVTRLRLMNDAQKLREAQQEMRQKSTDERQDRFIEMALQMKPSAFGRKTNN